MNRQIKFRAWDEKRGMVTITSLNFANNGEFSGALPLMQFTGLKDKKGNEIYEGDIIQDSQTNMLNVIEWDDKGFWKEFWDGFYFRKDGSLDRTLDRNHHSPIFANFPVRGIIIGNIFKNPEFLHAQEINT